MKFVIEMQGSKLLLEYEQLCKLVDIIAGGEKLYQKYVGGTPAYLEVITPFSVREDFKLGTMTDEEYGAVQLVTKLHLEQEAAKNKK